METVKPRARNHCRLSLARISVFGLCKCTREFWRKKTLHYWAVFTGNSDQELQMISWQFFTLFNPVMFYRLIYYDTLLQIQLWIWDLSWAAQRCPLLGLTNDLEGNRGCQCLQPVPHWQSSRAPSKSFPCKLSRSLRCSQMSKHTAKCFPVFFWCVSAGFPLFFPFRCPSLTRSAPRMPSRALCNGGSGRWDRDCMWQGHWLG